MKTMEITQAAKTFLQNAIEAVATREPFEQIAADEAGGSRSNGQRAHLTRRQLEVLELLCQGMTNKDISRTLGIGNATVKIHVSSILRALNVSSRLQASIAAHRLGLMAQRSATGAVAAIDKLPAQRPVVLRVVWDGASAQIIGVDQEAVI